MAENGENSLTQDKLIDCLTKQLSELELFKTMYNPREIVVTNTEVVHGIQNYIDKNSDFAPNHLDYTIIRSLDNLKLEISIHLPSMYPDMAPEIYVRSNELNRQQEKSLNTDLNAFLQNKHNGEVCIFTAIMWLQDNIENYIDKTPVVESSEVAETEQKFCRYWIYSHHIYCNRKIEEIVNLSRDLNLNGFCLTGKPGIMCVEGNKDDCKQWWKAIKMLRWQKIALRITEQFNACEKPMRAKFDKFDVYSSKSSSRHIAMESLQNFIEEVGLVDQINEYFGNNST